jgi:hypothetical protein
MTSANSVSILRVCAIWRDALRNWGVYTTAIIVRLKALAPYALIEIILPGGSMVALLLWLYRRRKNGVGVGLDCSALSYLLELPRYWHTWMARLAGGYLAKGRMPAASADDGQRAQQQRQPAREGCRVDFRRLHRGRDNQEFLARIDRTWRVYAHVTCNVAVVDGVSE